MPFSSKKLPWSRLPDGERQAFSEGVRRIAPSFLATLSWALVTGIAMQKTGLSIGESLLMSFLVYAGSAQLAVLPLLASGQPMWMLLVTTAVMNSRFVVFSAGLQPHFSYLPWWRRVLLGYFNGDLIYLYFEKEGFATGYLPGKESFYWGLATFNWLVWQLASIVGIFFASIFPNNWGLEFAGTLVLIPLMVAAVINRAAIAVVITAALVVLFADALPYRLSLPLAVFTALAIGMAGDSLMMRRPRAAEKSR
ncbi:MAG: AzlC family ABC transporter permease [Janthinobacterium lividum]